MTAAAKRFVSDPSVLVDTALRACVSLQPGVSLDTTARVVYRRPDPESPKVTVLSGGGSGHEPGHAGYVADGMLDAAVSGPIFASPSAKHIRKGLQHVSSQKGTLVIVKNYTGDRLNFGLAAELSRSYDGQDIETILVQDDVSVPRSRCGLVGRRGLAGVVLVHKIAGACAAEGGDLPRVTAVARQVVDRIATIGVSLEGCSIPGVLHNRHVGAEEMELGMGIHNEPGTRKIDSKVDPATLIRTMLKTLLDDSDPEHGFLKSDTDSQYALLINNLGGLSKLELLSLTDHVLLVLKTGHMIEPCRVFSGTYLSSLDGSGFSITLLQLPNSDEGKTLLRLLDAPTSSVNWPPALPQPVVRRADSPIESGSESRISSAAAVGRSKIPYDRSILRRIVRSIDSALRIAEPEITHFDTHLGDGDCGTTLLAGSSGLVKAFGSGDDNASSPADLVHDLQQLTDVVSSQMGGTSGALYSIFFSGFLSGLQQQYRSDPDLVLSLSILVEALKHGLLTMHKYTTAAVGDRTMMDALIPAVGALDKRASERSVVAFEAALVAAEEGRDCTKHQRSRYGRSTYVGAASDAKLEADSMPDPGACGIVAIFEGLVAAVRET